MPTATAARPHKNTRPDGPLTVEQRNELLAAWLRKWPYPLAWVVRRFPGMVRKAHYLGFTDEDLNAACLAAGVNAARQFDPAVGVKFTSYVCWHLRAGVQRLIGREATDDERRGGPLVSLHAPVSNGKGEADDLFSLLPGPAPDAARPAAREELGEQLWAAVERVALSSADRLVVELRYGLNGHEPHSLKEIADMLGVSKEAVRLREERMLRRCRKDLAGQYPEFSQDGQSRPEDDE